MDGIVHSKIFLLALTIAVYYGAFNLYKRFRFPLLNPLLVSIVAVICILHALGIDYAEYYEANSVINFMLGLSVVSLAYLLEQNVERLKGNTVPILASIFMGSLIAVFSIRFVLWLMGADSVIVWSLQPKSVTTPIAISIAESTGGIPALTSLGVVFAGILGSVVGPGLLSLFGVRDSVARGLAMGTASHAMGTAKAMEMGAVEGALGGAAIGIMGILTAILIPIVERIAAAMA